MSQYEAKEFIDKITKRTNDHPLPVCPFCGGRNYTTSDSFATIIIGKELNSISIGPSVPSGMLICRQCGHIDFFSLGVLGLLGEKDGQKNGESKQK